MKTRKIMQWVMAATLVFSGATAAQAQALKNGIVGNEDDDW